MTTRKNRIGRAGAAATLILGLVTVPATQAAAAPAPGDFTDPVLAGDTRLELGSFDDIELSPIFTGTPSDGIDCDMDDDGLIVTYLIYDPADLNHSWKDVRLAKHSPGHEGLRINVWWEKTEGKFGENPIDVEMTSKTEPGRYTVRIPVTQVFGHADEPGSCTTVGQPVRTTKWAQLNVTVTADRQYLQDTLDFHMPKTTVKAGSKIKVTVSAPSYLAGTKVHLMFPKRMDAKASRTGKAVKLKRSGNRAVAKVTTDPIAAFGSLYPVVAKTKYTEKFDGWLDSPFIQYDDRTVKWMKSKTRVTHAKSAKKSSRVKFTVSAPKFMAKTKVRVQHRATGSKKWRTVTTAKIKSNGKVAVRKKVPSSGQIRLKVPKTAFSKGFVTKTKKIGIR